VRLAFLIIACLWAVPTMASARAVLVVVHGPAVAEDVRGMVIEAMAVRGVRLVRTPDGEICDADPIPCAAAMATRTGADATLRVRVFAGDPRRVQVQLVPGEGDPIEVEIDVTTEDLAAAVATAVDQALDVAPPSVGFLMVRSDPPGASVEIDGERLGSTPLRASLAPGDHDVQLSHPTGSHETTVAIVAEIETSLEHRFGSVPDPADVAPGPRDTRTAPSPFNWIIGGVLAVGGVVTLISPLSTLAREGQCEEAIADVGCQEMVRFGAQSGVLLGVGLAALTAAVLMDAISPIRVQVAAGSDGARLGVEGTF